MKERQLVKRIKNGEILVGIGFWPNRKKPVLYVGDEHFVEVCATFINEAAADLCLETLTRLTGAKE